VNNKNINNLDKSIKKKHRTKITFSKLVINFVLCIFAFLCIMPMWSMVAISLSNNTDLDLKGYSLIPLHFDLSGYKYVLGQPAMIIDAYKISIFVTIVGTIMALMVISGVSYVISRPDFRYKNVLSFYIFFTMLFNGGLVPWYMLINNYLHLGDNIFVLILPYLANAWFILLLRTFFQKLPFEIIESCSIDGADEFTIFFRIVLPLSTPGLATIGLFIMLMYWNDWWLSMLFIENQVLVPLQLLLYSIMANIQYLESGQGSSVMTTTQLAHIPSESARMVMAILAAGPMLFVFPFFQKYFVKGLTVGAVKG
jgi:putative aldouronate transport system permease protein